MLSNSYFEIGEWEYVILLCYEILLYVVNKTSLASF
jgi:hypothetical protein